jgi:hypothetical protein
MSVLSLRSPGKSVAVLVSGIEEIEQSANGTLGPIAKELYHVCPDGNEQDFWRSYDAMAKVVNWVKLRRFLR